MRAQRLNQRRYRRFTQRYQILDCTRMERMTRIAERADEGHDTLL
jgi:hypothetical protein